MQSRCMESCKVFAWTHAKSLHELLNPFFRKNISKYKVLKFYKAK